MKLIGPLHRQIQSNISFLSLRMEGMIVWWIGEKDGPTSRNKINEIHEAWADWMEFYFYWRLSGAELGWLWMVCFLLAGLICGLWAGPPANAPQRKANSEREKAINESINKEEMNELMNEATSQFRKEMNLFIEWRNGVACCWMKKANGKPREPSPAASQHFIQFFSLYEGEEWMKWRRELSFKPITGCGRNVRRAGRRLASRIRRINNQLFHQSANNQRHLIDELLIER